MKIRGEIIHKFFTGAAFVQFYIDDVLTASLTVGYKERWRDVYTLTFPEMKNDSPVATISRRGIFFGKYEIDVAGQSRAWIYKREKWWYHLFNSKAVFLTHDDKFDIEESEEKIQVFKNDTRIGTARKVYESIVDRGEYYISFESQEYLMPFLILASVLAIETEVVKRTRGNV